MRATWHEHLLLFDIVVKYSLHGKIIKLHIFLSSFLTSFHLWVNIPKAWDQSSGPHKTTVKIRDLHFTFQNIQFLNKIRVDDKLEPKYGKKSPYLLCIYWVSDVIVILFLIIKLFSFVIVFPKYFTPAVSYL
jgi:hypothetical protein